MPVGECEMPHSEGIFGNIIHKKLIFINREFEFLRGHDCRNNG